HYEQLMAAHPEMARDLRGDLATQRLWAGDPAGALRDFDLRIVEEPTDRDARRLRALALAQLDKHAEALAAYDTLLVQDPDDSDELRIVSRLIEYRQPFGSAGTATFFLRRDALEDPGGSRDPFQLGAALDHRWSYLWSGHFMAAYLSPGEGGEPTGLYEAAV